jgi:hypothetical protein
MEKETFIAFLVAGGWSCLPDEGYVVTSVAYVDGLRLDLVAYCKVAMTHQTSKRPINVWTVDVIAVRTLNDEMLISGRQLPIQRYGFFTPQEVSRLMQSRSPKGRESEDVR